MKWSKYQPKDGDLVLVCSHPNEQTYHWYMLGLNDQGIPPGGEFRRPDGSTVRAKWMCICDACEHASSNHPERVIAGERLWTGDEPVIPDFTN